MCVCVCVSDIMMILSDKDAAYPESGVRECNAYSKAQSQRLTQGKLNNKSRKVVAVIRSISGREVCKPDLLKYSI